MDATALRQRRRRDANADDNDGGASSDNGGSEQEDFLDEDEQKEIVEQLQADVSRQQVSRTTAARNSLFWLSLYLILHCRVTAASSFARLLA